MKATKITWKKDFGQFVEIEVRNVGKLNPEAQIQIEVEERNVNKRTKFWSLNIPAEKVDEFLKAVQE